MVAKRVLATRVAAVLVAAAFAASGIGKLVASDMNVANFRGWGYPVWFMYLIGIAELAGGVLVLVPRVTVGGASLRFWGAAGLAAVMLGAVGTHVAHAEHALVALPLALLALTTGVAWTARPRAAARRGESTHSVS